MTTPAEIARCKTILRFLNGEGPIDGFWFGDMNPAHKGAFWWRKYLPEIERAITSLQERPNQ